MAWSLAGQAEAPPFTLSSSFVTYTGADMYLQVTQRDLFPTVNWAIASHSRTVGCLFTYLTQHFVHLTKTLQGDERFVHPDISIWLDLYLVKLGHLLLLLYLIILFCDLYLRLCAPIYISKRSPSFSPLCNCISCGCRWMSFYIPYSIPCLLDKHTHGWWMLCPSRHLHLASLACQAGNPSFVSLPYLSFVTFTWASQRDLLPSVHWAIASHSRV